jgi:hypothetical protein
VFDIWYSLPQDLKLYVFSCIRNFCWIFNGNFEMVIIASVSGHVCTPVCTYVRTNFTIACHPVILCQGWPNLLNVRATYDRLQMFESRKKWTNFTHTFLLLHGHFVTKIMNIKLNVLIQWTVIIIKLENVLFTFYMNCNAKRNSANIFPRAAHYMSKSRMWLSEPRFGTPVLCWLLVVVAQWVAGQGGVGC